MTVRKAFIKNDKATFVCPNCGEAKAADVSKFKDLKRAIRVKRRCACGYTSSFLLERRQFFRKDVNIPGTFRLGKGTVQHKMAVQDLSRSGVKMEVENGELLRVGDHLFLEFHLDNKQKTLIQKEVIVKSISGKELGTEFTSRDPNNPIDKAYDLAIGFYTFIR